MKKDIIIIVLSIYCYLSTLWILYFYFVEIDCIKHETERKTEIRIKNIYDNKEIHKPQPKRSDYIFDKDGYILPPPMR